MRWLRRDSRGLCGGKAFWSNQELCFLSIGVALIEFKGVEVVDEIGRLIIDNLDQNALGTNEIAKVWADGVLDNQQEPVVK